MTLQKVNLLGIIISLTRTTHATASTRRPKRFQAALARIPEDVRKLYKEFDVEMVKTTPNKLRQAILRFVRDHPDPEKLKSQVRRAERPEALSKSLGLKNGVRLRFQRLQTLKPDSNKAIPALIEYLENPTTSPEDVDRFINKMSLGVVVTQIHHVFPTSSSSDGSADAKKAELDKPRSAEPRWSYVVYPSHADLANTPVESPPEIPQEKQSLQRFQVDPTRSASGSPISSGSQAPPHNLKESSLQRDQEMTQFLASVRGDLASCEEVLKASNALLRKYAKQGIHSSSKDK